MADRVDLCKYVDVFYGNGEVDHFPDEGIASKWFYIKALCGNTLPHATLPFGRMSVGAYSSGYPTGYGTHWPNSCGGINKLWDRMKIRGFSHLHQSGTGAIQYYYNYCVLSPFYEELKNAFVYDDISDENAKPGIYKVDFRDVHCELTVSDKLALHSYRFARRGGRVAVDFSNDGLSHLFGEKFYAMPKDAHVRLISDDTAVFDAELSGIRMYFCVKMRGANVKGGLFVGDNEIDTRELDIADPDTFFGAVFDLDGYATEALVAYSTVSAQKAFEQTDGYDLSFDDTANKAYDVWNEYLSHFEIEASEGYKAKFYSNLYHSLIKPADLTGEDVMGVKGDCVSDYATFWDQYKTALPLIYAFYKDMGVKTAKGIVAISRALGRVSCSFGLSKILPAEEQAKMLGIISLCDAYYAGLIDKEAVKECAERELERDDFASFLDSGVFERYTHICDTADACYDVNMIAEDTRMKEISKSIYNAYGSDGLLSERSPYYEGDRYTYSFRLHPDMDTRIKIAGGRERFEKLLDDFFGFSGESVTQVTDLDKPYIKIAELMAVYHRFQGFNNEPDMETPYNYIFVGRHDKLCEIVNAANDLTFTTGRGGLPGNNDSGGLTSCFVWNALGVFPMAGTGRFLIGCPQIEGARLMLSSGSVLEIKVVRPNERARTVGSVTYNGKPVDNYVISADEFYKGGVLEFKMKA